MFVRIGSRNTLDEAYLVPFYYEYNVVHCAVFVPNITHPPSFKSLLIGTTLDLKDFRREHTFDGNYLYHFIRPNSDLFHLWAPNICTNARILNSAGVIVIF